MRITHLTIKNFKSFTNLRVSVEKNFNIIVGSNNAGKSTIFESLLLWKKCYDILISSEGKFYALSTPRYLNMNDLYFLRLTKGRDLFNCGSRSQTLEIAVEIEAEGQRFDLGVEITSPSQIQDSYFRIKRDKHQRDFEQFSIFLRSKQIKLSDAFIFYHSRPISNISTHESKFSNAYVKRMINSGHSNEVLRNKIGLLKDKPLFEKKIKNILGEEYRFEILSKNSDDEDSISVFAIHTQSGIRSEIALMGSGFLQMAELVSTIGFLDDTKKGLHLLLIDEPDSHIHIKLQKNLVPEIRNLETFQSFVISHNENFVCLAKDKEILYMSQDGNVLPCSLPDRYSDIVQDLGGSISALDVFDKAKRVLFVEGENDKKYIEKIISKHGSAPLLLAILNIRGRGKIKEKFMHSKQAFEQLSKSKNYFIIFDKDFLTTEKAERLRSSFESKATAYYHSGYCFESLLFESANIASASLCKYANKRDMVNVITASIQQKLDSYLRDINDITTPLYKKLEKSFGSQLGPERPEMDGISFTDFARELSNAVFLLNKDLVIELLKEAFSSLGIVWNLEDNGLETFCLDLMEKIDYMDFPEGWRRVGELIMQDPENGGQGGIRTLDTR